MELILPNSWRPRDYQLPLWRYMEGGGKRAVAVWHRRAGKDDVCLHWTAVAANDVGGTGSIGRAGNYWHMLPEAAQARKAVWDAVNPHTGKRRIDEAFPHALRATTREDQMLIRFKSGSVWQVVGSDNFNSLVGSPPVGIVFSEWALANPSAWDYLRPILAENGGWALFIYTPRGKNHGWDLLETARRSPGWFQQVVTVADSAAIKPEVIEQERREGMTEDKVQQEYYCSFDAAIIGAYYANEFQAIDKEKRISGVPYAPQAEVFTAWDLGIDDATAIWCAQIVGRERRIIDYYEASGAGLDHYVNWLRSKPYVYGGHYLPHDAEVKELGTGLSRVETLESLGLRNVSVVPRQSVEDGINAARLLLPQCWFDQTKCGRGVEALRQYRREWDDKTKTFRQRPKHDWASHGADAFRYLALALRDAAPEAKGPDSLRGPGRMGGWMAA